VIHVVRLTVLLMGLIVVAMMFVMRLRQQHWLMATCYAAFGFCAIGSVQLQYSMRFFAYLGMYIHM
jgi:hypothetical protein